VLVLVGRATEVGELKRRVARLRRGEGSATLVSGEPGVGKTALIQDLCLRAREVQILRADGMEAEASLGYSVLADICRPLLDVIERLPEPQAAALSGALALSPAAGLDRFAVYAGALSLLSAAAEQQPLLICVDDAQWIDVESAQALAFCARRIYAERIMLVLIAREGESLPFPTSAFEPLAIAGLDVDAAREIVRTVSGARITSLVASELHAATGGNPLALIESTSVLSAAQLEGRAAIEGPLAMGAEIERLFWRRIAKQPAHVRNALLIAAASLTGDLHEIIRALASLELGIEPLEIAEQGGLVRIDESRVVFSHPLLRAVVYSTGPAAERRAAHRALADSVAGPDGRQHHAWHRAAAAAGPDESVAVELEQVAAEFVERTGFATAATALLRAAALSESDQARGQRLLAAARAAFLAGMLEQARATSRQAAGYLQDPRLLADCARLGGEVEIYSGNVLEAHRLLSEAAERVAPYDVAREAELLTDAALPLFNAGQIDKAYEVARRAHERAAQVGGETEVIARVLLGGALILRGESRAGYKMALDGIDLAVREPIRVGTHLMHGGLLSIWVEDYTRARSVCSRLVSALRDASALTPLPYALAAMSELDFRTGQFAAALAGATEAVSLAIEIDQLGVAAYSLVSLARVEAALGRERHSLEHTQRALELSAQARSDAVLTYAGATLGLLELGLTRPDRALEHLAPLTEQKRRAGVVEPNAVQWQPDLVEAHIRMGQLQAAEAALAQLEREARKTGGIWAQAAAERYRGLLATDDLFDSHFAKAISLHERTSTPFERARTELCYGERLRRSGERRRAREQLGNARLTFQQLGATPWGAHAEIELVATGATRTQPEHERSGLLPQELLTARELQVALTIVDGKTNKEAAAALFLSPKTIEFHLGQIYRKLGVNSRTQLARTMRESQSPTSVGAPVR
jgi:DNA-binding CsgD family transcriptional regulator